MAPWPPRNALRKRGGHRAPGFTLVEALIATALSVIVMASLFTGFIAAARWWYQLELHMRAASANSQAVGRLVYGTLGGGGLREASGAAVTSGTNGWTLTFPDARGSNQVYRYDLSQRALLYETGLVVVCSNVTYALVATNANGSGATVRVDVRLQEHGYTCSNSMSTFVQFRNRHED